MTPARPSPSPLARHWDLDPDVVFLNHGSFGACPRAVLERQHAWQRMMEAEPVRFLGSELEPLLDDARRTLARALGGDADDLAFVPNATTGVNTVLRSLTFASGDELLTTDHAYNACRNALDFVAERCGARVVAVPVPFPIDDAQVVVDRVLAAANERTRLCLLDAVTSPTGLVLPVEPIVRALAERGVDTLVDGAHAPGMLPLALDRLGAAYYTGNCHKWLCAPKGAAFLHVRRDRQRAIHPLVISHGRNSRRTDRSRFRLEFDWTGTGDHTPLLCVPDALRFLATVLPGGLDDVRAHNHALALRGRDLLCDALGTRPPAPDEMIGSLASVVLPPSDAPPIGRIGLDPLQVRLHDEFGVEVPVMRWPHPEVRTLRISPQVYNSVEQYEYLAAALRQLL